MASREELEQAQGPESRQEGRAALGHHLGPPGAASQGLASRPLEWCFSRSLGSSTDPQPRHRVRPRCAFRDLGSAAPHDGHLVLGRAHPPHWPGGGPQSQNLRHRPGGCAARRLHGCPLLAAQERACAAADLRQGPRHWEPGSRTARQAALLVKCGEPLQQSLVPICSQPPQQAGEGQAEEPKQLPPEGINHPLSVLLVFFVSLIKLQSPSFEQYSLISSDVWMILGAGV